MHGRLRAVGGVAGLTLAARALGFARWAVQASTVGAGAVAGAYTTANQVPNVLYEVVVGGALSASVVPLLASAVAAGRREEVSRTASGLLGLVLVLLVPLGVALAVLAEPLAGLFPVSQGTDPASQHALIASFLRMFACQVPLYGIGVVLVGLLQAHDRFTAPALAPIASSAVVITTYAVYGHMTRDADPSPAALQVLGWGTTAGVAALSLPLAWPASRLGLRLRPTLTLEADTVRRTLRMAGAGLTALVAQQLSVLAVISLASAAGHAGTVAVYQYTQAVYVLPYAVLVVPLATVLYPRLAAAFTGPPARAHTQAVQATALVVAVAVSGAGALGAVAGGAETLFSRLADVTGMAAALIALAPGLVGYALIHQVTRVLFAADRVRGAALATAAGWLTVVAASGAAVALAAPHGGDGRATLIALGAGSSIGMSVAAAGLLAVMGAAMGSLRPVYLAAATTTPVALAAGLLGSLLIDKVAAAAHGAGGLAALLAAMGLVAVAVTATCVAAGTATNRHLLATLRPQAPTNANHTRPHPGDPHD